MAGFLVALDSLRSWPSRRPAHVMHRHRIPRSDALLLHPPFLCIHRDAGEEYVVNTSRVYYGLHRNGHLFHMSANIRPMEEGFGGACVRACLL